MIKKIGIALSLLLIAVISILSFNTNISKNADKENIPNIISETKENTDFSDKDISSIPKTVSDTPSFPDISDEQPSQISTNEETSEEIQETITEEIANIPENNEFVSEVSEPEEIEPPLPSSTEVEDGLKCSLSVRCDTILKNISKLPKEKLEIIPKDGVIFPETEVVFYEGESVFNVLSREMKKNKIHLDFQTTPIYNTAYIKGISNIYEFDCGDLSGWTYIVNGKIPNYGCSQYILTSGDKVEFVYTCELGKDVN